MRIITCPMMVMLLICSSAFAENGWQPDPKLLAAFAKQRPQILSDESKVPAYTLPDPLVGANGVKVTTAAEWEKVRRPETLALFAKHVYGRSPGQPAKVEFQVLEENKQAVEGKAILRRVKITVADQGGKSFAFETAVLIPAQARGPVPAFLLINNRDVKSADPTRAQKDGFWPVEEILARGYATAVFRTQDVDPDAKEEAKRAQGVRGVWPAGGGKVGEDAWATIGAWAWGASRVLDYLETLPEIDAKKVAVIGHSRGGKTALWAGAQDQRFAFVISNDSGCGGAALSRRKFGETVAIINQSFPYWFCDNFKKYNGREEDLPVDQHQLLALIAPRALAVGSADADFWADQRGEFLALAQAAPVYALYNLAGVKPDEMPALDTPLVRGPVNYHIRRGVHNLTPDDWKCYLDMADGIWPRK